MARILDLCDCIASLIRTTWQPVAPSAASREYGPDVGLSPDDESTLLHGRAVYSFPGAYAFPSMQDREILDKRYTTTALVIERYTEPGTPTKEWMDTRVNFVERVFKLFRDPNLVLLDTLIPDLENAASVDVVYDLDLFAEQRTFWSQMTLTFQEAAPL